jgi:hypothetical protein
MDKRYILVVSLLERRNKATACKSQFCLTRQKPACQSRELCLDFNSKQFFKMGSGSGYMQS